jgi:hypothetical protein
MRASRLWKYAPTPFTMSCRLGDDLRFAVLPHNREPGIGRKRNFQSCLSLKSLLLYFSAILDISQQVLVIIGRNPNDHNFRNGHL